MDARNTSKGRGEAKPIAATAALATLLLASFGIYSFLGTSDLLAFFAGLPLSLCAAGVLSTWMTLIRLDYGEEQAKERRVGAAAPAAGQRAPGVDLARTGVPT